MPNENKTEWVDPVVRGECGVFLSQAEEKNARKPTILQRFLSAVYFRLLVWIYPHHLGRAILLEFRSLILRIQILRETKLHVPGKLRNPRLYFHARQYPPSCKCELACIRDTEIMLANYPWATVLDQALFWEGWNMGARFHRCRGGNPCCCNRTEARKA